MRPRATGVERYLLCLAVLLGAVLVPSSVSARIAASDESPMMAVVAMASDAPVLERVSAVREISSATAIVAGHRTDFHFRRSWLPDRLPLEHSFRLESAATAQWGAATNSRQKKLRSAVIGGVVGFFAGGIIGAKLDNCGCDDPGLSGFIIGAPVGAAAGAVVGFGLASR